MAILKATAAAVLFGISAPVSKLLLNEVSPIMMAALLYLGAGIGMLFIVLVQNRREIIRVEAKLSQKELPYVIGMIVLDIAAPILLMTGLSLTSSSNAALLNNFEIVATTLIALLVFKEAIGTKLWISIILITIASIILSFEDILSFTFSIGSVFVLMACACWGLENNFTRMLSLKNPAHIVIVKGFGSGLGALAIAFAIKDVSWNAVYIVGGLVLGFFAYGLSIFLYVTAQRDLGAARTSAYYAVAPFIGVGLSFAIFNLPVTLSFAAALLIMVAGSYLAASEDHFHIHKHEYLEHEHRHSHNDDHHNHSHEELVLHEHSHLHIHKEMEHSHKHSPDLHHKHGHK
jgi:drug/metabolite transporter (DMT)-like permease